MFEHEDFEHRSVDVPLQSPRPPERKWDDPDVQMIEDWIDEKRPVWIKSAAGEWTVARVTRVTADFRDVLVKFENPAQPGQELSTAVSFEDLFAWQEEHPKA